MDKKPFRRFELSIGKINDLEDVKKILQAMKIRIDTDSEFYDELKDYFQVEVVPRGYVALLKKLGYEKINKMTYDEMENEIAKMNEKESSN